jgi:DNA-binding MarR family transcriptional regulator
VFTSLALSFRLPYKHQFVSEGKMADTRERRKDMSEEKDVVSWEESETHRACRAFMVTDRMHRRLFEGMVADLGMHRSQHFLLMNIDREGVGSQKELAARLNISTAAVAVSLKKLEAEGYIERNAAESDSRNNEIRITDEGKRVISVSRDYIRRLDEAMFLGIDGEALAVFVRCLDMMQKNLSDFASEEGKDKK